MRSNKVPIRGVQIELIPADKTGDARWYATLRGQSDKDGSFLFDDVPLGTYVVAFQHENAPDREHPYGLHFYGGGEDERLAERISVVADQLVELQPVTLGQLKTAQIPVEVAFADGLRPAWSNLLFSNSRYPHQAVIGDVAPGIENGKGEMVLPLGFEYYARAKVDCDAGSTIETRESRPIQVVDLSRNSNIPPKLSFVIPGTACKLWSPD